MHSLSRGGIMRYKNRRKEGKKEVLWPYILMALMLFLGIIFGVMATNVLQQDQRSELTAYLESYFNFVGRNDALQRANSSLLKEALNLNLLKTTIPIFLASLSLVGVPLIAVIGFLRGFIVGFGGAFLIREMQWRGGMVFLAGLLPQNIFIIPGLVILGGAAIIFSIAIISAIWGNRRQPLKRELQEFLGRTAVGILVILLGCFMEAYVTPGFLRLLVRL